MDPGLSNVDPVCTYCSDNIISVRYVLIECSNLNEKRLLMSENNKEELNISIVPDDYSDFARLFNFLIDVGFIGNI